MGNEPTTLNFVSSCKVTEITAGILNLEGDGFTVEMKYNPKNVSPVIDFKEVTDTSLKRYWPDGVTRIVFTVTNPGVRGKNEIEIREVK